MRRTTARAARAGFIAAAGLAGGLLLAGCSSPAEEPAGLTASPSPSATTSAPEGDADDEAAVLDVYDRFWAANVQAERGNPDPALYAGVAEGPAVELELAIARQYEENGIVKDGEPVISERVVEIDGDQARVAACVDHTSWVPAGAPVPDPAVVPTEVVLTRVGGAWLVKDYVEPTLALPC